MTYEQFCTEYKRLFRELNKCTPNQVGSIVFCEKMAALAEKFPEFEERLEEEEIGAFLDEITFKIAEA